MFLAKSQSYQQYTRVQLYVFATRMTDLHIYIYLFDIHVSYSSFFILFFHSVLFRYFLFLLFYRKL